MSRHNTKKNPLIVYEEESARCCATLLPIWLQWDSHGLTRAQRRNRMLFGVYLTVTTLMAQSSIQTNLMIGNDALSVRYRQLDHAELAGTQFLLGMLGFPLLALVIAVFSMGALAMGNCCRGRKHSARVGENLPLLLSDDNDAIAAGEQRQETAIALSASARELEKNGDLKATTLQADCENAQALLSHDQATALIYLLCVNNTYHNAGLAGLRENIPHAVILGDDVQRPSSHSIMADTLQTVLKNMTPHLNEQCKNAENQPETNFLVYGAVRDAKLW